MNVMCNEDGTCQVAMWNSEYVREVWDALQNGTLYNSETGEVVSNMYLCDYMRITKSLGSG